MYTGAKLVAGRSSSATEPLKTEGLYLPIAKGRLLAGQARSALLLVQTHKQILPVRFCDHGARIAHLFDRSQRNRYPVSTSTSTPENLYEPLLLALQQWHSPEASSTLLADLAIVQQIQREKQFNIHQATVDLLTNALERLTEQDPDGAQLLQERFVRSRSAREVAQHLHVAESTLFVIQRKAVERLCTQIEGIESEARSAHFSTQIQRLEPSTYEALIGIDEHLERLAHLVTVTEPPRIISLEGIGGIGKTSIADALLRKILTKQGSTQIGWVSARQRHLNLGGSVHMFGEPALSARDLVDRLFAQLVADVRPVGLVPYDQRLTMLRSRLNEVPHIIVVDNLETLLDVESLLPTLHDLANPTKFILTSRERVYGVSRVYHYGIPELSPSNAIRLLRLEAKLSNLPSLEEANDDTLLPIVKTVGGNPLALRLVVGQAQIHGLDSVLSDLKQAQGQSADNLYTFIYRQAWERLDRHIQEAFLIMPLARPQGDDLGYLAEMGGIDEQALREALDSLVRFNLVDVRGDIHRQLYSIHGLTRTFLQEQVAKWM